MLDIKWIRENGAEFDKLISQRGVEPISAKLIKLDEERRQLITLIQQLQHARKEKSKSLSYIKDKKSREFETVRRDVTHINEKIDELNAEIESKDEFDKIMDSLPNIPEADVPYGVDEASNKIVKKWGEPKEISDAKHHFEIGESLKMMDFEQTAKISGSRFVTLKKDLARLERALISFMIDTHVDEFDYEEVSPPVLVRDQAMYNVGQLPKFSEDSFQTVDNYRLIPTGEVPLTNLVADKILSREELPMRFVAYTPCFRSEAGSAGRDTRGMIRMHQFGKVELVHITTPDESKHEHEYLLNSAENILRKLELPYQVMLLCTGDMGFSVQKTYDLEVWLPGQKKYREISSCSNCGDFQARRMKTRYRELNDDKTTLVHTLNGSGLAVGRTLLAIIENYQNPDGSVTVPEVLRPYMGGNSKIEV